MNENNTKKPLPDETGPRAFSVILQQIADGDAHSEVSAELQRLLKTMSARAKDQNKSLNGELTLKLKIAVDERGVLAIGYDVKTKEPSPKRAASTFWIDKAGNASVTNPRQIELGLRDVSDKKAETRDIAPVATRDA